MVMSTHVQSTSKSNHSFLGFGSVSIVNHKIAKVTILEFIRYGLRAHAFTKFVPLQVEDEHEFVAGATLVVAIHSGAQIQVSTPAHSHAVCNSPF